MLLRLDHNECSDCGVRICVVNKCHNRQCQVNGGLEDPVMCSICCGCGRDSDYFLSDTEPMDVDEDAMRPCLEEPETLSIITDADIADMATTSAALSTMSKADAWDILREAHGSSSSPPDALYGAGHEALLRQIDLLLDWTTQAFVDRMWNLVAPDKWELLNMVMWTWFRSGTRVMLCEVRGDDFFLVKHEGSQSPVVWTWRRDVDGQYWVLHGRACALPRPEPRHFTLLVRSFNGATLSFRVLPSDTVQILKCLIYDDQGIPPSHQRLIYEGRNLQDEQTLASYGLHDESMIQLALRICGGMQNSSSSNSVPPLPLRGQIGGRPIIWASQRCRMCGDWAHLVCTNCNSPAGTCPCLVPICVRCPECWFNIRTLSEAEAVSVLNPPDSGGASASSSSTSLIGAATVPSILASDPISHESDDELSTLFGEEQPVEIGAKRPNDDEGEKSLDSKRPRTDENTSPHDEDEDTNDASDGHNVLRGSNAALLETVLTPEDDRTPWWQGFPVEGVTDCPKCAASRFICLTCNMPCCLSETCGGNCRRLHRLLRLWLAPHSSEAGAQALSLTPPFSDGNNVLVRPAGSRECYSCRGQAIAFCGRRACQRPVCLLHCAVLNENNVLMCRACWIWEDRDEEEPDDEDPESEREYHSNSESEDLSTDDDDIAVARRRATVEYALFVPDSLEDICGALKDPLDATGKSAKPLIVLPNSSSNVTVMSLSSFLGCLDFGIRRGRCAGLFSSGPGFKELRATHGVRETGNFGALAAPVRCNSHEVRKTGNFGALAFSGATGNHSGCFLIYIKALGRPMFPVTVSRFDTTATLKAVIAEMKNIPVEHQRLLFSGKQLEDDLSMRSYNIQRDSIITLVVRLDGGMQNDTSAMQEQLNGLTNALSAATSLLRSISGKLGDESIQKQVEGFVQQIDGAQAGMSAGSGDVPWSDVDDPWKGKSGAMGNVPWKGKSGAMGKGKGPTQRSNSAGPGKGVVRPAILQRASSHDSAWARFVRSTVAADVSRKTGADLGNSSTARTDSKEQPVAADEGEGDDPQKNSDAGLDQARLSADDWVLPLSTIDKVAEELQKDHNKEIKCTVLLTLEQVPIFDALISGASVTAVVVRLFSDDQELQKDEKMKRAAIRFGVRTVTRKVIVKTIGTVPEVQKRKKIEFSVTPKHVVTVLLKVAVDKRGTDEKAWESLCREPNSFLKAYLSTRGISNETTRQIDYIYEWRRAQGKGGGKPRLVTRMKVQLSAAPLILELSKKQDKIDVIKPGGTSLGDAVIHFAPSWWGDPLPAPWNVKPAFQYKNYAKLGDLEAPLGVEYGDAGDIAVRVPTEDAAPFVRKWEITGLPEKITRDEVQAVAEKLGMEDVSLVRPMMVGRKPNKTLTWIVEAKVQMGVSGADMEYTYGGDCYDVCMHQHSSIQSRLDKTQYSVVRNKKAFVADADVVAPPEPAPVASSVSNVEPADGADIPVPDGDVSMSEPSNKRSAEDGAEASSPLSRPRRSPPAVTVKEKVVEEVPHYLKEISTAIAGNCIPDAFEKFSKDAFTKTVQPLIMRATVVQEIKQNKQVYRDDYAPCTEQPMTFEVYLRNLIKEGTPFNHMAIKATAKVFGVVIHMLTIGAPVASYNIDCGGKELWIRISGSGAILHATYLRGKLTSSQTKKLVESSKLATKKDLYLGGRGRKRQAASIDLTAKLRTAEQGSISVIDRKPVPRVVPVGPTTEMVTSEGEKRVCRLWRIGRNDKYKPLAADLEGEIVAVGNENLKKAYANRKSSILSDQDGKAMLEERSWNWGSGQRLVNVSAIPQSRDLRYCTSVWKCHKCDYVTPASSSNANINNMKLHHAKESHPLLWARGEFKMQPMVVVKPVEADKATWMCPVPNCGMGLLCFPLSRPANRARIKHWKVNHPQWRRTRFAMTSHTRTSLKLQVNFHEVVKARAVHDVEIWKLPTLGVDGTGQTMHEGTTVVLCGLCGRIGDAKKDKRRNTNCYYFENLLPSSGHRDNTFILSGDCSIDVSKGRGIGAMLRRHERAIDATDKALKVLKGKDAARVRAFRKRVIKLNKDYSKRLRQMQYDVVTQKAIAQYWRTKPGKVVFATNEQAGIGVAQDRLRKPNVDQTSVALPLSSSALKTLQNGSEPSVRSGARPLSAKALKTLQGKSSRPVNAKGAQRSAPGALPRVGAEPLTADALKALQGSLTKSSSDAQTSLRSAMLKGAPLSLRALRALQKSQTQSIATLQSLCGDDAVDAMSPDEVRQLTQCCC